MSTKDNRPPTAKVLGHGEAVSGADHDPRERGDLEPLLRLASLAGQRTLAAVAVGRISTRLDAASFDASAEPNNFEHVSAHL